jgi:hypothetical protein
LQQVPRAISSFVVACSRVIIIHANGSQAGADTNSASRRSAARNAVSAGKGKMNDRKRPLEYAQAEPGPSAAAILVQLVVVAASIVFGLIGIVFIALGLTEGQHAMGSDVFPHNGLIEGLILIIIGAAVLAISCHRLSKVSKRLYRRE